ncbi:MAG TPA: hypothetical protein VLA34_09890 [Candidatus Krumholzibacterium sp.]|nr:hypothetical protein [Candidatus Krumholzibacterium sp.]
MKSLELREEIRRGNVTYFLQTSFIGERKQIQSSFYRNGTVFDTFNKEFEEIPARESLRELTKDVHAFNKSRFQSLLDVRDRLSSHPEPAPHVKVARALLRRNLLIEAIAEAEIAIGKGSVDSTPLIVKGEAWFRLEEYDKAFEAIETGLRISPDYPDLHNLMGKIYYSKKICKKAVDSFRRAIGLNLYYGEPYLNLVKTYLLNSIVKQDYEISRDLKEKYETNMARAVQLNPFLDTGTIEQAGKLFREEKYEETLELLESIELDGSYNLVDDIILELYLSILGSGEDLPESAIEQYIGRIEEIIDQNPTYADAFNSMGILYTAKCKILMDKASTAFSKALEINPDYAKALKNKRLTENDRQGVFILLKALLD